MTGLPRGWEWTTVEDVADVVGGVQKSPKRRPAENAYPMLRVANVHAGRLDLADVHQIELFDGEIDRLSLRPGDCLVVEGNGSISQVGRAVSWGGEIEDCVHQNHVLRARPRINPRFLSYWLQSPRARDQIERVASSTSGLHVLSGRKLRQLGLPVPAIREQERIVDAIEEHLSRLDAAGAALTCASARLDVLESRAADEAFSGLGIRMPVGELAEVRGGIQKQPKRTPNVRPAPFLRVANVGPGTMNLDEVHEVELFDGELERYRLRVGDLLVVEGNGSPDQIGRSAVWHGEIDDCVHQNHLIRVRPGPHLDPEFLGLFWNSPSARAQLSAVASSTSGLYSLSTAKVKRVEVPVVGLDQQNATVALLSAQLGTFEHLRASLKLAGSRQKALRRSILAAAFSGQLAPQDPDDEPASVLLERIRAERDAATPAKRARKAKAS